MYAKAIQDKNYPYEVEPPKFNFKIRVERDNSPATLAHPSASLGFQKDGSLVFGVCVMDVHAKDLDYNTARHALLSTVFRWTKRDDFLMQFDTGAMDYSAEFDISNLGLGKIQDLLTY